MSTLIQTNSITSSNLPKKRLGILFFLLLLFAFLGIYLYLRNSKRNPTIPIPTPSQKTIIPSTKKPEIPPLPLPTPQGSPSKEPTEPDSPKKTTNPNIIGKKNQEKTETPSNRDSQTEKDVIRYHFVKELINYFGFKGSFTFYDSTLDWEEKSHFYDISASIPMEIKVNNRFFTCKIDIYAKPPFELNKIYEGTIKNCFNQLAPLLRDLHIYPLYKNKKPVGHFKFDILHGTDRSNYRNKYLDLFPREPLTSSKETLQKIENNRTDIIYAIPNMRINGFSGNFTFYNPEALIWKRTDNSNRDSVYYYDYHSPLEIKVNNKLFSCNINFHRIDLTTPLLLPQKTYKSSINGCDDILVTLLKESHTYSLYKNGKLIGYFKFVPIEVQEKDKPYYDPFDLVPP